MEMSWMAHCHMRPVPPGVDDPARGRTRAVPGPGLRAIGACLPLHRSKAHGRTKEQQDRGADLGMSAIRAGRELRGHRIDVAVNPDRTR